jgi:hypothetical protein
LVYHQHTHDPIPRPLVYHQHTHDPIPRLLVYHQHTHDPIPRPLVYHQHTHDPIACLSGSHSLSSLSQHYHGLWYHTTEGTVHCAWTSERGTCINTPSNNKHHCSRHACANVDCNNGCGSDIAECEACSKKEAAVEKAAPYLLVSPSIRKKKIVGVTGAPPPPSLSTPPPRAPTEASPPPPPDVVVTTDDAPLPPLVVGSDDDDDHSNQLLLTPSTEQPAPLPDLPPQSLLTSSVLEGLMPHSKKVSELEPGPELGFDQHLSSH